MGPFVPKKTPNTTKSDCIFHLKLRSDGALIFVYPDSARDKFFLWKYLLSLILITGIIAQKLPKLGPIGSQSKKIRGIQKVKSRMANTQTLKLMDSKTMSKWPYYRLCDNLYWPFRLAPGGNLGPFWTQKMFLFG